MGETDILPSNSALIRNHVNPLSPLGRGFIVLFGVVLPVVTLGFESVTHMCGEGYLDPIPSYLHFFLILGVAVANGLALWVVSRGQAPTKWMMFAMGGAVGVSSAYALIFAPITPIACLLVVFWGLGFLPLAPVLSFLSGLWACVAFTRLRRGRGQPAGWRMLVEGAFLSIAVLIVGQCQVVATNYGLSLAHSADVEKAREGISVLRNFGNEDVLLRNCYEHRRSVDDLFWFMLPTDQYCSVEDARKVYYRVFGKAYNSVPRPPMSPVGAPTEDFIFSWDWDVASDQVGGRNKGLKLASSSMEEHIDSDAATEYIDWTMQFHNTSWNQQEARAQIKLPKGGVVTRATLWVNGVPREAAFGERNHVRAAYVAVVSKHRDPLLVEYDGPDRVMVQCFPVPRNGDMKIRLGITAPCRMEGTGKAVATLPQIAERDFDIDCKHILSLDAGRSMLVGGSKQTIAVDDSVLSRTGFPISLSRGPVELATQALVKGAHGEQQYAIQRFVSSKQQAPKRVIVVLDAASSMKPYLKRVENALRAAPADLNLDLMVASDIVRSVGSKVKADGTESVRDVLTALHTVPCEGGPDDVPALRRALRIAQSQPSCAVLWIHGPQPAAYEEPDPNIVPKNVSLYDFDVQSGPNSVLKKISCDTNISCVAHRGDVQGDLKDLFEVWSPSSSKDELAIIRTIDTNPVVNAVYASPESATHIEKLIRLQEVRRMLLDDERVEATKLAARSNLITPVSGAVVLETDADYKKQGLDPNNPDKNNTPLFKTSAAPEPHEYALMAVALLFLWYQSRRKKQLNRRCA